MVGISDMGNDKKRNLPVPYNPLSTPLPEDFYSQSGGSYEDMVEELLSDFLFPQSTHTSSLYRRFKQYASDIDFYLNERKLQKQFKQLFNTFDSMLVEREYTKRGVQLDEKLELHYSPVGKKDYEDLMNSRANYTSLSKLLQENLDNSISEENELSNFLSEVYKYMF